MNLSRVGMSILQVPPLLMETAIAQCAHSGGTIGDTLRRRTCPDGPEASQMALRHHPGFACK